MKKGLLFGVVLGLTTAVGCGGADDDGGDSSADASGDGDAGLGEGAPETGCREDYSACIDLAGDILESCWDRVLVNADECEGAYEYYSCDGRYWDSAADCGRQLNTCLEQEGEVLAGGELSVQSSECDAACADEILSCIQEIPDECNEEDLDACRQNCSEVCGPEKPDPFERLAGSCVTDTGTLCVHFFGEHTTLEKMEEQCTSAGTVSNEACDTSEAAARCRIESTAIAPPMDLYHLGDSSNLERQREQCENVSEGEWVDL